MRAVDGDWSVAHIRISASSVVLVFASVIAAVVLKNVFVAAHRPIGWAVAAALLAALLLPAVNWLDRYLPRFLALLMTLLAFGLVFVGAWVGVRLNIGDELDRLKHDAPEAAGKLEAEHSWLADFELSRRVDDLIAEFDSSTSSSSSTAEVQRAAGAASSYFVSGIMTLFFMIFGPRIIGGGLAQLPASRRRRWEKLVAGAVADARAYASVMAAQAVVVGGVVGLVAFALELPAPLLLGLIAGVGSILPTIGVVIGAIPTLLFAAAFASSRGALLALVVVLALQAIEVAVVHPVVRRRSGDVGPALTVIVSLIAFELYGLGGAVYAFLALVLVMSLLRRLGIDEVAENDT